MTMILEIALGVVLGLVIFACLEDIAAAIGAIAKGLWFAARVALAVSIAGGVFWIMGGLVYILIDAVIRWS